LRFTPESGMTLVGTMMQRAPGGNEAPVPLNKGDWKGNETDYRVDLVSLTVDGKKQYYLLLGAKRSLNDKPSVSSDWVLQLEDGEKGDTGPQGPPGDDGIQGPPGEDGRDSYFHIAYADDAQGNGFSQNPAGKAYIGTYTDS